MGVRFTPQVGRIPILEFTRVKGGTVCSLWRKSVTIDDDEHNQRDQTREGVETDALIVPVFEGPKETRFGAGDLSDAGEIAGKPLEITLLHHVPGVAASRVLLAGAGKPEKFTPAELRKLVAAAVRHLKAKSVKKIAFALDPDYRRSRFCLSRRGRRHSGRLRTGPLKTCDDKKSVDSFAVVGASAGLEEAVRRGRILAEAQNFSRDLVNEPANLLPPSKMADAAQKMAAEFRLGLRSAGSGGQWRSWAWARCWAWRREAPSRRR